MVSSSLRLLMSRVFDAKYDSIEDKLTWNKYWMSGSTRMTGLFNVPGFKLELERGRITKTVDDYGRRAILIGTAAGVIVVYQTHAETKSLSLSMDYDKRIKALSVFNEEKDFDMNTLRFVLGENDACPDARQYIDELLDNKEQQ